MILNDDDRPIQIRPRKPPVARREGAAWASGYRLLMHYARGSRKADRNAGAQRATGAGRPNSRPLRQGSTVIWMAIRGVRSDGQPLRLKRDYVKHGIRGIAEDYARVNLDIVQAGMLRKPNAAKSANPGLHR